MYDRIRITVTKNSNKDVLHMFIRSAEKLNLKNPPAVRQG